MNQELVVLGFIFIVSIFMAVRSARQEIKVLESVRKIKIRGKKGLSGVILFLKEKIVHYSSDSS